MDGLLAAGVGHMTNDTVHLAVGKCMLVRYRITVGKTKKVMPPVRTDTRKHSAWQAYAMSNVGARVQKVWVSSLGICASHSDGNVVRSNPLGQQTPHQQATNTRKYTRRSTPITKKGPTATSGGAQVYCHAGSGITAQYLADVAKGIGMD